MAKYILASGIKKKTARKAMGCRYGRTAANMKAFGKKTWPTATADLFWQMAMFLKATGLMIRLMVLVTTFMLRELLIKDNGLKINRKAMAERSGLMAVITRANMFVEKSMAGACSSGLMGQNITDYGKIIKCTEKEN